MPHIVAFCLTLLRCIATVKKSMTRCKVGTDQHGSWGNARPTGAIN